MDLNSLSLMARDFSSHGYWFLFFIMLIEGPIATIAGGFAGALGFLNPYFVFLVSIPGDLVADVGYYLTGYWLRSSVVDKFVARFGVGKSQIEKLDSLLEKHTWSTLLAIKLAPFLPTPGLMIVGNCKVPFKKFIIACLYIIIPKSLAFVLLGYYSGIAGVAVAGYLKNYNLILIVAVISILIIYWGYNKVSVFLSRRFQNIFNK